MVNKTHELYKNIWWFRKKVVLLQRKSLNDTIYGSNIATTGYATNWNYI